MSNGTTAYPAALDSNTVRNNTHEITSTDHNDHSVQIEAIETALGIALRKIYPVGSLYTNVAVATNPGTLLGFGTWTAFGTGRVLVGVDTGQTEFDVLGETGGEKTHTLTTAELASHNHIQDAHSHTQDSHNHTQNSHTHTIAASGPTAASFWDINDSSGDKIAVGDNVNTGTNAYDVNKVTEAGTATNQAATATNQSTTATNQTAGSGTAHNNLQPYITVYMWQRTV